MKWNQCILDSRVIIENKIEMTEYAELSGQNNKTWSRISDKFLRLFIFYLLFGFGVAVINILPENNTTQMTNKNLSSMFHCDFMTFLFCLFYFYSVTYAIIKYCSLLLKCSSRYKKKSISFDKQYNYLLFLNSDFGFTTQLQRRINNESINILMALWIWAFWISFSQKNKSLLNVRHSNWLLKHVHIQNRTINNSSHVDSTQMKAFFVRTWT